MYRRYVDHYLYNKNVCCTVKWFDQYCWLNLPYIHALWHSSYRKNIWKIYIYTTSKSPKLISLSSDPFKKKQRKLFQEICTSSVFFLCCSYHNYTLHLPRPIQNTLVSCKQINWDNLCNAISETTREFHSKQKWACNSISRHTNEGSLCSKRRKTDL